MTCPEKLFKHLCNPALNMRNLNTKVLNTKDTDVSFEFKSPTPNTAYDVHLCDQ